MKRVRIENAAGRLLALLALLELVTAAVQAQQPVPGPATGLASVAPLIHGVRRLWSGQPQQAGAPDEATSQEPLEARPPSRSGNSGGDGGPPASSAKHSQELLQWRVLPAEPPAETEDPNSTASIMQEVETNWGVLRRLVGLESGELIATYCAKLERTLQRLRHHAPGCGGWQEQLRELRASLECLMRLATGPVGSPRRLGRQLDRAAASCTRCHVMYDGPRRYY